MAAAAAAAAVVAVVVALVHEGVQQGGERTARRLVQRGILLGLSSLRRAQGQLILVGWFHVQTSMYVRGRCVCVLARVRCVRQGGVSLVGIRVLLNRYVGKLLWG